MPSASRNDAKCYEIGRHSRGATGPTGPTGPAGNPYLQATASGALADGAVCKRVSGGNVTLASGGTAGSGDGVNGVVHPAAADTATATFYPTGTRAPVAGVPVGSVYRSNTGTLVAFASLVSGEKSNAMGYSDGVGVDVNIGEEFPVP